MMAHSIIKKLIVGADENVYLGGSTMIKSKMIIVLKTTCVLFVLGTMRMCVIL